MASNLFRILLVFSGVAILNSLVPAVTFARPAAVNRTGSVALTIESGRTITANVLALDQPLVYNRLGATTPGGMIYALRKDVVKKTTGLTANRFPPVSPPSLSPEPEVQLSWLIRGSVAIIEIILVIVAIFLIHKKRRTKA